MWTRARYRFVRELAEGGFARVSLAHDLQTGESVVIKHAKRDGLGHRMREEAEMLRSLPEWRVPGTPRLIDCFEENGRTFLVQEYLDGEGLYSWQQQSPTIAALFDVYAGLAHAVERLHAVGVIHRDLKPSNVLLVEKRPYLLDFGLSAHGGDDDEESDLVGTPLYMSPEMVHGSTRLQTSADVFSLGVMLYEGMTGVLPFDERGGLSMLLSMRASYDLSRDVRFPELGLPEKVLDVFRTMLAINPSSRPSASTAATALHAAAALSRLEHKSTTIPLPVPRRESLAKPPETTPVTESNDLHRAALRIAELEAHLERTAKLTESLAIVVKGLGDKLNPEAFQEMVRQSVLVSMRDMEVPSQPSDAVHDAQKVIGYLTKRPELNIDSLEALKGHVDFAIITIKEEELAAVLHQCSLYDAAIIQGARDYSVGEISTSVNTGVIVAVTRCPAQGNGVAQDVARDIIADLDPRWILVVGIAGGVPSTEFSLGDVVLGSHVLDFSVQALRSGRDPEFAVQGRQIHPEVENFVAMLAAHEARLGTWYQIRVRNQLSDTFLEQPPVSRDIRQLYGSEDWQAGVVRSLDYHAQRHPRRPRAVAAPIGASDLLIKDNEILEIWQKVARHVRAIEMESAGVHIAARERGRRKGYPVLSIRGISDIVGLRRDERWTQYACETAAAFAAAFIRSGYLKLRR